MKTLPPAHESDAEPASVQTEEIRNADAEKTTTAENGAARQETTETSQRSLFRRYAGNSQWRAVLGTVTSQGGIFGIQALHSIILARLLGPTQRGEYATIVFFSQILIYSGLLGTLFSIARRAAQASENRHPLANAAMRVGFSTGSLCLLLVGLLSVVALPQEKTYLAALCILAAFQLPFEHSRLALLAVDHGSGDFKRYNQNRLLSASVFPILLGICWLRGVVTLEVIVAMTILSSFLGLCQLIACHREVRPQAGSAPKVSVLVKEGLPYASAYFAAQLLGRLDTLLMLWFMSFTAQGYYAVALAAAALLHIVPNALALFAFNTGAKTSQPSRKSLRNGILAVLSIQIASAVVLALILHPLISLLFGSRFDHSYLMTLALLPGLAIDGIATVAEGYLRGQGRPFSTLRPRILGAIVIVPTVFLLNPYWHDLSIPIAASLGHAVSGLAILWVLMKSFSATPVERAEAC